MYTLDLKLFLLQILPPPWRGGWRYKLISVLLQPIEATLEDFRSERLARAAAPRSSMQVISLEATLSNMMQGHVRIEHRAGSPFVFFVRIGAPNDSPLGRRFAAKKGYR